MLTIFFGKITKLQTKKLGITFWFKVGDSLDVSTILFATEFQSFSTPPKKRFGQIVENFKIEAQKRKQIFGFEPNFHLERTH